MADSRCAESIYERRQLVLARRREIVRLAGSALPGLVVSRRDASYVDIAKSAVLIAIEAQREIDMAEGKDGF